MISMEPRDVKYIQAPVKVTLILKNGNEQLATKQFDIYNNEVTAEIDIQQFINKPTINGENQIF